jgi:uncharacterized membrane protein YkvA (DUF1232 family)
MTNYTDSDWPEGTEADVDAAAKLAQEAKGGSKLKAFWSEVSVCARMAKATIAGKYPMKAREKAILISGLAYVVLPIDAIPDVIPGVGYVDDVLVIAGVVAGLTWEILEFKKWEANIGNVPDQPFPAFA